MKSVITADRPEAGKVVFSIDLNPPHKKALTVQEVLQRAKWLKGHDLLVMKDLPLYVDKAKAHPGTDFLIGADAFHRLWDPQWGVSSEDLQKGFIDADCGFLVFDRGDKTLDNCPDSNGFTQSASCTRFTESCDISSTQLREGK